jgi:hypothetical protein
MFRRSLFMWEEGKESCPVGGGVGRESGGRTGTA